jgi:Na+/glutamate symporter
MDIWVALLAFAGTVIGSLSGVLVANKLVNYRLEQLEKKVDKHNCLVERMYKVEERCSVTENDVKVANHRIEDLEKESA